MALIEDAEFVTETEKAILVKYQDEEMWLPKSHISWCEEAEPEDLIDIEVADWLAREKGIDVG